MYYIFTRELALAKSRRSLNSSGALSKMIMCKQRYTIIETNIRSRRSLNIIEDTSKQLMVKQVRQNVINTGKKIIVNGKQLLAELIKLQV